MFQSLWNCLLSDNCQLTEHDDKNRIGTQMIVENEFCYRQRELLGSTTSPISQHVPVHMGSAETMTESYLMPLRPDGHL